MFGRTLEDLCAVKKTMRASGKEKGGWRTHGYMWMGVEKYWDYQEDIGKDFD